MSLLAVLLLSFWSAASACELQCSLAQAAPCCLPGSTPQGAMAAMPGMLNMHQQMSMPDTPLLVNASSCLHSMCVSTPALSVERNSALPYPAPSMDAVLIGEPLPALAVAPSAAGVRGPPRSLAATPVSLHILVRV